MREVNRVATTIPHSPVPRYRRLQCRRPPRCPLSRDSPDADRRDLRPVQPVRCLLPRQLRPLPPV